MWTMNSFIISTDKSLLDVKLIHEFISTESYWGLGRSREVMEQAINNSTYCFGVYIGINGVWKQVGFARVVSDITTFGYIADVFVIPEYRNKGIGKWLIKTIVNHPDLRMLKRFALFTQSPGFYESMFEVYDQASSNSKFMVRQVLSNQ